MLYQPETTKTSPVLAYAVGKFEQIPVNLPQESPLTIVVNGRELVTLMCTRTKLNFLVVGYLWLEGVVNTIDDIDILGICDQEVKAEVRINIPFDNDDFRANQIKSSGCTGGTMSGKKNLKPLDVPNVEITASKLFNLMKSLYSSCDQYHLSGGIHGSGLSLDGENLTCVAEDIGRHNTLDKVAGECVIRGYMTRGAILLTTGRISYDMVAKASRMETPIVVSRTSPTLLAQELAQELGITLVGYVRGDKLRVYSCHSRVIA